MILKVFRLFILLNAIGILLLSGTSFGKEDSDNEQIIRDILLEQSQALEFEKIQETINEGIGDYHYDLHDFYVSLQNNEFDLNLKTLLIHLIDALFVDIRQFMKYMIKLLLIVIFAALFNNLSDSFNNKQVIKISNLVIMISITSVILTSFEIISLIASNVVSRFDEFITALIPGMVAVSVMSGSPVSGNIFTQSTLMLSFIINRLIQIIFMPFLYLVLVLIIINSLSANNSFKKLTELLIKAYYICLKVMIWLFLGFYSLQSMGLSSVDNLISKTTKQTIGSVPVVGATLSELSEIVIVCGNTTKNLLGIGVIVGGVIMALYPTIKILIISFMYKSVAALIEPISDKKIVNCLSDVGDVCFMTLSTVLFVLFLFIISISLCIYISNIKGYLL